MSLGLLLGKIGVLAAILVFVLVGLTYVAHRRHRTISPLIVVAAGFTLLLESAVLFLESGLVSPPSPVVLAWLKMVAHLSGAWFALTVLDAVVIGEYLIERKGRYIPDVVRALLIAVGVVVAGLVLLRLAMNINVVALVALPTVATAVIGVALKDTLTRFFAGVQLGKMVKIGDWIATLDREGVVTHIGMEHVVLYTREQDYVSLPNDNVIQAGIINYSRPSTTHLCSVYVEAAYRIPPHQVCATLTDAASSVEGVLPDPKPIAMATSFNDSGIQYRVKFPIGDYARYPIIESAVRTYIWNAFHRKGIEIPFPQRVVHTADHKPTSAASFTETSLVGHLASVDFLATLREDQLECLARETRVEQFLPGERVVRQGDAGSELYVIIGGTAEVRVEQDGFSSTVTSLGPDQCFGEMSLLTGEPRSATVMATTVLRVLVVHKDALSRIIENDPRVVERIGETVAARRAASDLAKQQLSKEASMMAVATQTRSLIERIQNYLWNR